MLTPDYIVGLTEGEGCFLVCLRKDYRIELRFFITQAIGNRPLLEEVREFFRVGTVYQKSDVKGKLPSYVFEVTKRDEVYEIIIPFFKSQSLKDALCLSLKAISSEKGVPLLEFSIFLCQPLLFFRILHG